MFIWFVEVDRLLLTSGMSDIIRVEASIWWKWSFMALKKSFLIWSCVWLVMVIWYDLKTRFFSLRSVGFVVSAGLTIVFWICFSILASCLLMILRLVLMKLFVKKTKKKERKKVKGQAHLLSSFYFYFYLSDKQ